MSLKVRIWFPARPSDLGFCAVVFLCLMFSNLQSCLMQPRNSVPLSVITIAGAPWRAMISSVKQVATVEACLSGRAKISIHLVRESLNISTYLFPALVSWKGPVRSMWVR